MLFIWQGWGCLVPFFLIIFPIIVGTILKSITDALNVSLLSTEWELIIGLLLASIVCWFLGKRLNRNSVQILLDEKTGQRIKFKNIHSFFFIPFEYWGIIAGIGGIVLFFNMCFFMQSFFV